ncbi:SHOCT domain-containing protein [Gordonia sp. (in: high G+C Gram-positive bacteria)]|uniref:SHOCT domain-containing protein n=1 Tax=Gordonia sp. (in: high G+C Gram-positive bacteria) TaxID=84139 RepID=UPI0026260827|nr:SHOCT domain-containing protein [Gordonia sp. (in: high G+C Gram-positive bacteria)]
MDWGNWWNVLWYTIVVFAFIAYLIVLFMVLTDLFRDRKLATGWKCVWIFFLVVFPYLTAFVYIIARGPGMAERSAAAQHAADAQAREYIREAAGTATPADQIATAKALLDAGTITEDEFAAIKAKALA